MRELQEFAREDPGFRLVATDEGREWVIDLGADATDASVDVVDDTLLVVLGPDRQYDVALPSSGAEAFIRNGVVTISTEASE